MNRRRAGGLIVASTLSAGAVGQPPAGETRRAGGEPPRQAATRGWMTINGKHRFALTLEDSPTGRAFAQLLPITLDMPDLNDNEKHVRLPRSLPVEAMRPGTIRTGDVMLWGDNTLVVFYKTFASSYSYTRIGRVDPADALAQAVGPGSARIAFAME